MTRQSSTTRRSKEQRRREIVRVAAKLFAEKGYHATSMAELAEAVGLGKGALYYHIGSKEELLFEISTRHVERMIEFGNAIIARDDLSPVEKLRALSRRLMQTISESLPELTVFFREVRTLNGSRAEQVLEMRRRFEMVWEQVIIEGIEAGVFRQRDPIAIKGMLGLHNYSYIWLNPQGRLSPEEISDVFCDLILDGSLVNAAAPCDGMAGLT